MQHVVITGICSGLGKAIADALWDNNVSISGIDIDLHEKERFEWPVWKCDVRNRTQLVSTHMLIRANTSDPVSCVINCAGINHITPFVKLKEEDFDKIIATNVKSILLVSQTFLPDLIKTKGTIVNVVSNASHMPMTHSFAYNASKGAADIVTKQMARELTKQYGITVFGISPNKLKGTEMSRYIEQTFPPLRGMTIEEGEEYQRKGLLTGKETEPEQIANIIAFLLESKWQHEFLSGCVLPMGL